MTNFKRIGAVVLASAIMGLGLASPMAFADSVALTAGYPGNQNFGGNLGLDFTVSQTVTVIALGAYDSLDQSTITPPIDVGIYQITGSSGTDASGGDMDATGTLLTSTYVPAVGVNYGPVDGYLYTDIMPIVLHPGLTYSVVAVGFNSTNNNGNDNMSSPPSPNAQPALPGIVNFIGDGRFDSNSSLDLPTETVNQQGFAIDQATIFAAGSFAIAVPFPLPPALDSAFSVDSVV